MSKEADKAEEHRIQGEMGRLVEVGFLESEHSPEGAILKATLRIFGVGFDTFSDPRPRNKKTAEVMVECELPGL